GIDRYDVAVRHQYHRTRRSGALPVEEQTDMTDPALVEPLMEQGKEVRKRRDHTVEDCPVDPVRVRVRHRRDLDEALELADRGGSGGGHPPMVGAGRREVDLPQPPTGIVDTVGRLLGAVPTAHPPTRGQLLLLAI